MAALLLAAPAAAAQSPGSPGLGDPYFPLAGNGGYEVDHYDLNLSVRPSVNRLRAVATISATSTGALSAFDLDLEGLRVTAVTVDGAPAAFAQRGPELSVTPATPIRSGAAFTVAVAYGGSPRSVDGTGWLRMRDGTWVASEPSGALSWFPCNDHPSDKATFSFSVTVPKRYRVIANGLLDSVQRHGRSATFAWHEPQPMATYLATVMTGRFRLRSSLVNGLPSWSAVVGQKKRRVGRTLRKLPRILSFLSSYFGPYPFSSTGSIVTPGVFDGALETQTRPVYFGAPLSWVVAHEQAHQWFGDAVSIQSWSDIWLNEGFATFAQWLWEARGDDRSMRFIFRGLYRSSTKFRRQFGFRGLWGRVVSPPKRKLFGAAVYFRGGMTLEALREMVGDTTFFSILRDWVQQHKYGNATTDQFIALAEAESGRSLSHFFDVWLRQPGRPSGWT